MNVDTRTPVVILEAAHHGGLGIARSLGRLGVPVYGVDASAWQPAFFSRYCKRRFALDIERDVRGLLRIGQQLGHHPILIPTSDRGAGWVTEHARSLREVFRFQDQTPGMVNILCDKTRMQELAARSGIPIARSLAPRSKGDIAEFLQEVAFPVMVKSTDTERFRRRTGGSKFLVQTRDELLRLYDRAADGEEPSFLIQEFIPGDDWMFNGYFDRDSQCLFGVTGKKVRRFPANTGVTSLGVCLRNETVERTATEFMKAISYRGILDIGFRYDRRDGRYKILDANPRIGCTFRLFTASNGMDVARALYLDMTGQPVPLSHAVDGRKWLVEDFDLFSALGSWRSGALRLKDWARSLRDVDEAACFALDDLLPFPLMWLSDCREWFRWIAQQKRTQTATDATVPFIRASEVVNSYVGKRSV